MQSKFASILTLFAIYAHFFRGLQFSHYCEVQLLDLPILYLLVLNAVHVHRRTPSFNLWRCHNLFHWNFFSSSTRVFLKFNGFFEEIVTQIQNACLVWIRLHLVRGVSLCQPGYLCLFYCHRTTFRRGHDYGWLHLALSIYEHCN